MNTGVPVFQCVRRMSVTPTYAGSPPLLTQVTNTLGRSLTLTYSGADIAAVTDDTGRTVTYS